MLTPGPRPKTKTDEVFFTKYPGNGSDQTPKPQINISRLIELDRLTVNSREAERVEEEEAKGSDPDLVTRKPSETRGGVMEKLFKICGECGEEFCHGGYCAKFDYEQHKELHYSPQL